MPSRGVNIAMVDALSLSRLLATLIFAALAFQKLPLIIPAGIYFFAMTTDVLDGYLARRLDVDTFFGRVVDLISDKSLTIVSMLYAAVRGIDMLPLALISVREVIMIGARIIIVDGAQLLPTSRVVGGIMGVILWGSTLLLIIFGDNPDWVLEVNKLYWMASLMLAANLGWRIFVSARKIRDSAEI